MRPRIPLESVWTATTLLEGLRAASSLADAVAGSGAEAVGDLASAAHSADPMMALAAVHALAVCDDLEGAAVLPGLLHDKRRYVSEHALHALRHTTPVADALPHLVGAPIRWDQAREMVRTRFGIDMMAASLSEVYRQVAPGRPDLRRPSDLVGGAL